MVGQKTLASLVTKVRAEPEFGASYAIAHFLNEVGRLMQEQGVTRAELARRLDSSPAYVTKLLGMNSNVTMSTVARVFHALGARPQIYASPILEGKNYVEENGRATWTMKATIIPFPKCAASNRSKANRLLECLGDTQLKKYTPFTPHTGKSTQAEVA